MSYILEVQEDKNGESFIILPDDIIETLGWQEGDVLEWKLKANGVLLTKLNDSAGYEVIEE
jgi:bifunctional DNA-binding transcriptional regulator/antitoxin component of YhaV-PrlF toxin-antitoxin module